MPATGPGPWWGWHRLDSRQAHRLVARAGVEAGDLVIDVGAGDGAITAPLLAAGARVIAVELHPGRAAELRRRFAGQPVCVVQADARHLYLPRRAFRVVANPPFAVTTALLRRLLSPPSRLQSAHLVVPQHVAARWSAGRAQRRRAGMRPSMWSGRIAYPRRRSTRRHRLPPRCWPSPGGRRRPVANVPGCARRPRRLRSSEGVTGDVLSDGDLFL